MTSKIPPKPHLKDPQGPPCHHIPKQNPILSLWGALGRPLGSLWGDFGASGQTRGALWGHFWLTFYLKNEAKPYTRIQHVFNHLFKYFLLKSKRADLEFDSVFTDGNACLLFPEISPSDIDFSPIWVAKTT